MGVQGFNNKHELVYWNKVSEDIYGYSLDEIKNKKIEDIFNGNDNSCLLDDIDKFYDFNISLVPRELEVSNKNNTMGYIYSTFIVIEFDSDNKILLKLDIDLSANKESQRKDKILLEQTKLASMGEMIANISHQWRQPLSIITTAVTSMKVKHDFGHLDDEYITMACNIVNKNAQYLSGTIDDFKNFIMEDRVKKIFKLKNNVDTFTSLVESSAKDYRINMIINVEDDIEINECENELTQCFVNMFNNSKDILNEKNIENKLFFISIFKKGNNLIIKIKDNGGGIPKDVITKVFEPYFTTKGKSQGTGLGLHMTYNLIVDGMNGTIEVQNSKYVYNKIQNEGAEFTIVLPL